MWQQPTTSYLDKNPFLKFMSSVLDFWGCLGSDYLYWSLLTESYLFYPDLTICAKYLELRIINYCSSLDMIMMFHKYFINSYKSRQITWASLNRLEIRMLSLKWTPWIIFSNICLLGKNYPRDIKWFSRFTEHIVVVLKLECSSSDSQSSTLFWQILVALGGP